jgi:uncharacterized repeat protein (TIGR03803 family)
MTNTSRKLKSPGLAISTRTRGAGQPILLFPSLLHVALMLAVVLNLGVIATPSAHGQTYRESLLHSFKGSPDGSTPTAGLVRDAAGNLYGTTFFGGDPSCTDWQGNMCGLVFKVTETGIAKVLYTFTGASTGENPYSGVVRDAAGNLYGAAWAGGHSGYCGALYKLSKGKETVLFRFTGADGCQPEGGLILDAAGNIYGTTESGGPLNLGTVFKLDKNGKETVLHFFTGSPDGLAPSVGLVMDDAGNLYGTTAYGGDPNCINLEGNTCGIVFKVDVTGIETVLHSFTGGGVDGENPFAGLILDDKGNLYGTTANGGTSQNCQSDAGGCGTVFKLETKTGKETVIYSFNGAPDGANPLGGVVQDGKGILYGTTVAGGAFNDGTVFRVTQSGKHALLHSFNRVTKDGADPYAGLIRDPEGRFYGTTYTGGKYDYGTVFKLTPR